MVEIAVAALAIALGGTVKGAIGMGAPLVATPILAGLYGVPTAVAVMTIPLLVSNAWQMWTFRAAREGRRPLYRMLVGCALGAVAGTFLLNAVPEDWLAVALAVIVFLYLCLRLLHPDLTMTEPRAVGAAVPAGLVSGVLQGMSGISSPVSVTFIHAQRLPREAHLFALSAMFSVLALAQGVALTGVGLMTWPIALAGTAAIAPILLGVWLGQKLGDRFSARTFERMTLAGLAVIAIVLLVRAVPELMAG